MPIYEYECSCCGARFEERRGFHEDRVALCPRCKGHGQRLLSAVPIIFKGSGFYVTDYPKTGQSNLGSPKAAEGNGASDEGKKPSPTGGDGSKAPAASSEGSKTAATAAKEG
ncbi:MAG: hypothetical protein HYY01_04730 [Chloroflexi bacterium]|nr:hypothetical protein [Chloroflexota bacterium]